jgi:hypothetical protein
MSKEPAPPSEVLFIVFGGSLISIILLFVILKVMQIRGQRKNPHLYRLKRKPERSQTAPKKKRRRSKS